MIVEATRAQTTDWPEFAAQVAPEPNRPALQTMLLALGLGLLSDALFYGKPLGISVPLFTLLAPGALLLTGKLHSIRPAYRNL